MTFLRGWHTTFRLAPHASTGGRRTGSEEVLLVLLPSGCELAGNVGADILEGVVGDVPLGLADCWIPGPSNLGEVHPALRPDLPHAHRDEAILPGDQHHVGSSAGLALLGIQLHGLL